MCIVSSSTVDTHPVDVTAAAPYSAVFTCSIYGYGYQNVTWHREANKLPQNHQIIEKPTPRIITTTLTIPNVTEQDAGKYYCQVWANNIRTQSDRANLYYAGKYVLLDIYHYFISTITVYLTKIANTVLKNQFVCIQHVRICIKAIRISLTDDK